MALRSTSLESVVGTISSAGFGRPSGSAAGPTNDPTKNPMNEPGSHRFVIGRWERSPVGRLVDVMWARPDGGRVLLVGSEAGAEFITSIYHFDEVRVGSLEVTGDDRTTEVDGMGLRIRLDGGRRIPIPFPRPLTVTRFIEAPIARALMGVETYGTSPTGAREWYQSRGWRWVIDGWATVDGIELGPPGPITEPLAVGFSEPPPRPSIVTVRTVIERPTGSYSPTTARGGAEGVD